MKKLVVVCLVIVVAVQSCVWKRADSKEIYTEQKSFDSFEGIKVTRLIEATVVHGDEYSVKINMPQYYADSVSMAVDSENNLVVHLFANRIRVKSGRIRVKSGKKIKAEITCPSFNRLIAGDLSDVKVMPGYSFENIKLKAYALSSISFKEQIDVKNSCQIDVSDCSNVKLNLTAENLVVNSRSISTATISGAVSTFDANAGDMSKIKCQKLIAKTVNATASSMSEIFVHADEKLELSATDISKIRYSGDGELLKRRCESLSMVKKK